MVPKRIWLGVMLSLVIGSCDVAQSEQKTAQERMHQRLMAVAEGKVSPAGLRIQFMDGGMAAHRSVNIEAGTVDSKEWTSPGSPMIHLRGSVPDAHVAELVQQLIAKQYWTFQGTRFTPDATTFLFRFWYGDLEPVDFSCDAEEFRDSPSRSAIRDLFLAFVAETEMRAVASEER